MTGNVSWHSRLGDFNAFSHYAESSTPRPTSRTTRRETLKEHSQHYWDSSDQDFGLMTLYESEHPGIVAFLKMLD